MSPPHRKGTEVQRHPVPRPRLPRPASGRVRRAGPQMCPLDGGSWGRLHSVLGVGDPQLPDSGVTGVPPAWWPGGSDWAFYAVWTWRWQLWPGRAPGRSGRRSRVVQAGCVAVPGSLAGHHLASWGMGAPWSGCPAMGGALEERG